MSRLLCSGLIGWDVMYKKIIVGFCGFFLMVLILMIVISRYLYGNIVGW